MIVDGKWVNKIMILNQNVKKLKNLKETSLKMM